MQMRNCKPYGEQCITVVRAKMISGIIAMVEEAFMSAMNGMIQMYLHYGLYLTAIKMDIVSNGKTTMAHIRLIIVASKRKKSKRITDGQTYSLNTTDKEKQSQNGLK